MTDNTTEKRLEWFLVRLRKAHARLPRTPAALTPDQQFRSDTSSRLLKNPEPATWAAMKVVLSSLCWPGTVEVGVELPWAKVSKADVGDYLKLWQKIGVQQLPKEPEGLVKVEDRIQAVLRAAERKGEAEQEKSDESSTPSGSAAGSAYGTVGRGSSSVASRNSSLTRSLRDPSAPEPEVKPFTSPQLSPPRNATPGHSRSGLRSSGDLPRAPHDLGYIGGSQLSGAGRKRTPSLIEEGEDDEDDLPTPSKVMADVFKASHIARSQSREAERAEWSSRGSSELTTVVNSDDDEPPPAKVRGKRKVKATNRRMEEDTRDDDSDRSDCVVVEVKSTAVSPSERIEVGAVVMARWPTTGDYEPGAWFGLVLDRKESKGAWWESIIEGEPHPDAYLLRAIPTGACWAYIRRVVRYDPSRRMGINPGMDDNDKEQFAEGKRIASNSRLLKNWSKEITGWEKELEKAWRKEQQEERKQRREERKRKGSIAGMKGKGKKSKKSA